VPSVFSLHPVPPVALTLGSPQALRFTSDMLDCLWRSRQGLALVEQGVGSLLLLAC